MHVNARKMAFGGLLLALTVICMALGSVIETNTLFLLAAASYFVGIVYRETGLKTGIAFYLAAVLLGGILSPNKFYVLTFAAMGFYILTVEAVFCTLGKIKGQRTGGIQKKRALFWVIKYVIFNLLYLPTLFGFQELLFGRKLDLKWMALLILAGQVLLFLYDRAYEYTQSHFWNKIRGKVFHF